MSKKTIISTNANGQRHGYQELYDTNGVLSHRGNAKNGYASGYCESHFLTRLTYYIIR